MRSWGGGYGVLKCGGWGIMGAIEVMGSWNGGVEGYGVVGGGYAAYGVWAEGCGGYGGAMGSWGFMGLLWGC